jgi:hypothetical protein
MQEENAPTRLERAARVLQAHGVEFIVIGGQADCLFGSPRVTYEVDICYRRTRTNLERLAEALKEIRPTLRGAPPDLPVVPDVQALSLGSNYTFDSDFGELDLLGWVEPLGDCEAPAPHAEVYRAGDLELKVIGLDDLIRVREHIGRAKDRDSLYQLLAIKRIRQEIGRTPEV